MSVILALKASILLEQSLMVLSGNTAPPDRWIIALLKVEARLISGPRTTWQWYSPDLPWTISKHGRHLGSHRLIQALASTSFGI